MSKVSEFERTKQLLEKWTLPVGEEKEIEVEFCGDKLKFKARVLPASKISKLRKMGIKVDGTLDVDAIERANNEFIREAILEPEIQREYMTCLRKEYSKN